MIFKHNTQFNLLNTVRHFIQIPEVTWATMFTSSFTPPSLRVENIRVMLGEAEIYARACWHGIKTKDPESELQRKGVRVMPEKEGEVCSEFIHFAVYDPSLSKVEYCENAIRQVTSLVKELSQFPGLSGSLAHVDVRRVVLWHEYYHAVSSQKDRLKEELTAVVFSKVAEGLTFSPQILQWLLVYCVNPSRAMRIANNIIEMSVMK